MGASQQHATTNTGDFTNSPRCAASMTRRPHSFKRGATEAVLQVGNGVNSPRETPSPCLSPSSQVSSPEFGIDTKKHQHQHPQQQQYGQNLTFRVRFGAIQFLGKKNAGFDLGIVRERKRLGNFMFVCFCGFFLVLGLIKICATGWMSGYSKSGVTDKGINFLHQERENSFRPENEKTLASKKNHGVWSKPYSDNYTQCIHFRDHKKLDLDEKTNGFILINANGGLNQMRFGICDVVAIAKVMKATLVLPSLDHTSYWADESGFKDLFDWKHFIIMLKDDINIVETLPSAYADIQPFQKTPISWSKVDYYKTDVLPLLQEHKSSEILGSNRRTWNHLNFQNAPTWKSLHCSSP